MLKNSGDDSKRPAKIGRLLATIFVAIGIFYLGLFIGQGKINFGKNAIFHKTENASLPDQLDLSSIQKVYSALRKDYDGTLTVDQLLDGLKQGLATATNDPYTEYMNSKEAKDFNNQLDGTFSGIGAELDKQNGNIVVISPITGYPAEKAGLKPKDVIVSIDGSSTANMTVSQAVSKIRGEAGTSVTLKIVRGSTQQLSLTITRAIITIPSVTSKILPGNIGYMSISRFGEDTAGLAKKAAQQFKDAKVKGVILDLRGDPGGLLDAAVDVSSLWLPSGKTVLTERRGGVIVQTFSAKSGDLLGGLPTVVLIDGGSASASEITAGALKDNNAAKLMGEKSFGKGSVQQVVDLADGSQLKVTIARWFTPAGKNSDKEGITPDTTIKLTTKDIAAKRDAQLLAAENALK